MVRATGSLREEQGGLAANWAVGSCREAFVWDLSVPALGINHVLTRQSSERTCARDSFIYFVFHLICSPEDWALRMK